MPGSDCRVTRSFMHITLLFFGYLLSCLIIAAIFSIPVLHFSWLSDLEPERFIARLAQVIMLLGFIPLLRALQLTRRDIIGQLYSPRAVTTSIIIGWLMGVWIMASIILLLLALGIRAPVIPDSNWLIRIIQALVGGLLIATIEELFFRGAVFSAIRRHANITTAVIGSSILYSLVHFVKPIAPPTINSTDWHSGFLMIVAGFQSSWQLTNLDSFIALFLAGVLLALIREQRGHIGWCIGIHAGWVWVIQSSRRLTDGVEHSNWYWLVGHYDGVIGWLAAGWLILLILWQLDAHPKSLPIVPPNYSQHGDRVIKNDV